MSEDSRCCGSGTCIIDEQGLCWCGQQWDGQTLRMASPRATQPNDTPNEITKDIANSPPTDLANKNPGQ
ncbi:MAG: hypothetical protein WCL48_08465 [Betaproteobacteria bacterium]